MKTLKAFRLSDEAVAILDQQGNATEYLENLILGNTNDKVSFTEMYDVLNELLASYLDKFQVLTGETVQPPTPAEKELLESLPVTPACCLSKTPCRHWVWSSDKMVYVNSISGEKRDPDV